MTLCDINKQVKYYVDFQSKIEHQASYIGIKFTNPPPSSASNYRQSKRKL